METVCRDACSGHDVARVRVSRRGRGEGEGEGEGEGGREERKKGRRERGRWPRFQPPNTNQPLQWSTHHSVKKYYLRACTL